jgi:homoserine dehydrogenase
MKKVKVALLGLGNVGSGVWNIIQTNEKEILKKCGYKIEISKILVRDKSRKRNADVPEELLTTDFNEILEDDEIKIVVELLGGLKPAKEYMLKAIAKKKHIVTANKLAIATEGDEIIDAARKQGVMLYYEASVGGGIPIIHEINESLTANKLQDIYGIINGTTNYILSCMSLDGMSFEDALKEAQDKGYAEADPTSDVEAYDAMYKLAILSSLAFGTKIDVDSIYREGITKVQSKDIEFAKEFGCVIKLLAIGKRRDCKLELRVHPVMIPETHPLANVNNSFNAVFIKGNAVGDLMLYGRGAGDLPTGSAVVGDIISILRNNINEEKDYSYEEVIDIYKEVRPMEETKSEYYIRLEVQDIPGTLGEISSILGKNDVSLASVIQKEKNGPIVTIVVLTHLTEEKNINTAIDTINKLSAVVKVENIIRVERFKN